mgnify:CR=1 FL=1
MGRVVKPKVIMNADGSTSMALPTESGAGGPGSGNSVAATVTVAAATPARALLPLAQSPRPRACRGITAPSFNLWGALESLNKHE